MTLKNELPKSFWLTLASLFGVFVIGIALISNSASASKYPASTSYVGSSTVSSYVGSATIANIE